ncbi:MAG TPA: TetR/AcrR family transcriptional regulator [Solirubrobacteraceae bacterium]|jgi:AcrR family transcriptional regulator|nr:TetR/AcrR family transcriptional regulator [Solirubrobacteraceae bacterium]
MSARSTTARARPELERQGAHVESMQRRRLMLGMTEVLAERGLEDTSVGRICKRAGVSRRTFYGLFDGRDECLLAAFEDAIERLTEPVTVAWRSQRAWRDRVAAALAVLLERFDAEPELARLCVVETLKAAPPVLERRARILSALVAAVEQGRTQARGGSEPPPLAGQGVVGGVLSIVHTRLVEAAPGAPQPPLSELYGALMAMIVHPYLGAAAARRESEREAPEPSGTAPGVRDPFSGLSLRFTYRTARVLATIAAEPGASNRIVATSAGIADDGQTSRLLARLSRVGLIENNSNGHQRGEANAWRLTERGEAVQAALAGR